MRLHDFLNVIKSPVSPDVWVDRDGRIHVEHDEERWTLSKGERKRLIALLKGLGLRHEDGEWTWWVPLIPRSAKDGKEYTVDRYLHIKVSKDTAVFYYEDVYTPHKPKKGDSLVEQEGE